MKMFPGPLLPLLCYPPPTLILAVKSLDSCWLIAVLYLTQPPDEQSLTLLLTTDCGTAGTCQQPEWQILEELQNIPPPEHGLT